MDLIQFFDIPLVEFMSLIVEIVIIMLLYALFLLFDRERIALATNLFLTVCLWYAFGGHGYFGISTLIICNVIFIVLCTEKLTLLVNFMFVMYCWFDSSREEIFNVSDRGFEFLEVLNRL